MSIVALTRCSDFAVQGGVHKVGAPRSTSKRLNSQSEQAIAAAAAAIAGGASPRGPKLTINTERAQQARAANGGCHSGAGVGQDAAVAPGLEGCFGGSECSR